MLSGPNAQPRFPEKIGKLLQSQKLKEAISQANANVVTH